MENNKRFELSDDVLDEVAGGLLLQDEATDGRTTTQVTTRVCCSKCNTNKGWLFAWPDGDLLLQPLWQARGRGPLRFCPDPCSGSHFC